VLEGAVMNYVSAAPTLANQFYLEFFVNSAIGDLALKRCRRVLAFNVYIHNVRTRFKPVIRVSVAIFSNRFIVVRVEGGIGVKFVSYVETVFYAIRVDVDWQLQI